MRDSNLKHFRNPFTHPRMVDDSGILQHLDEFYFATAEKKILENYRCIVPNFINDSFISIVPTVGRTVEPFTTGPSKLLKL